MCPHAKGVKLLLFYYSLPGLFQYQKEAETSEKHFVNTT